VAEAEKAKDPNDDLWEPDNEFDQQVPDETGVSVHTPIEQEKALVRGQAVERAKEKDSREIVVKHEVDVYRGAGLEPVDEDQLAILNADVPDEDLEILPTGEVYASQVKYRQALNRAFKPMGWALIPLGDPRKDEDLLSREYGLYVRGRYASRSFGEQQLTHGGMTYPTALESAKSNALMRCCKDLGIASKCWDKQFCDRWREKFAVQVWVEGHPKSAKRGKTDKLWRRKDAKPFDYPWVEQNGEPEQRDTQVRSRAVEPPRERPQKQEPDETPMVIVKNVLLIEHREKVTDAYTRWAFRAENGQVFKTFDVGPNSVAAQLKAAMDEKRRVTITGKDERQLGIDVKKVE
jgi:hypothetical protein